MLKKRERKKKNKKERESFQCNDKSKVPKYNVKEKKKISV